jgi:predicted Zn-dependent peptidase
VEPPQLGPKTVKVEKEAQMPLFLMVYHAPRCSDDDYYPMSILGSVLLQGKSSRLYKRLVREEQLAISVRGGIYETIDPYLFSFSVQPKQDGDLDRIEAIIIEEIEKIKKEGITKRELAKVLNSVRTRFFNSLQTIAGIANLIGRAEVLHGDYGRAFNRMEYYGKVKLEDVKKAANKYFTQNNKTVGKLIPSGGAK